MLTGERAVSLSFGSTPAHAEVTIRVTIIVLFLWRMFDAARVRRASVCHALEISSPSLCVNVAAGYYLSTPLAFLFGFPKWKPIIFGPTKNNRQPVLGK